MRSTASDPSKSALAAPLRQGRSRHRERPPLHCASGDKPFVLLRGQIPPPDPGPEPLNQHHERVISCGFLAKSSVDGVGAAGSNEGTQRAEDKAVPKLASRPHVGREIPRSDRYCRELIGGEFPVIQGRSGFSSVLSVVRCRSGGPKVGGSNPLSPTPENPCFGGDSRRFGMG